MPLFSIAQKRTELLDTIFSKYALTATSPYTTDKPYYICKCNDNLPQFSEVVRKLSEEHFIIRITQSDQLAFYQNRCAISHATDEWKFSPSLERSLSNIVSKEQRYIITGSNLQDLTNALHQLRNELIIVSVDRLSKSAIIKCKPSVLIQRVVPLKEVIFIDAVVSPQVETNIIGYDRSWHGINAVDFLIPGANGRDIVAGVKEQRIDENDIDVWKRVLPSSIASTTVSYHATVIASIIGGAGNSSYFGKGIAWRCKFFPSSFTNLFADDASILNANKVTVQNHSYGTVIQQFYGAEALSYDLLTWQNKIFIPVISAGNQGTSSATEGKYANLQGYANLTGNFKMAKNVITVAAMDKSGIISPLSSAGPMYDGRLAPQITALGPNGTSDAAAIVTGTIAVMQQVYADSNNNTLPPASLVKAILYNTGDDIYTNGIDYKTGYGLLNSYAAVLSLQRKQYDGSVISQGQQWNRSIFVPSSTAQLKVTLAWADSASTINNSKGIVNDLDLEVIEPGTGKIYRPWVLSTFSNKDSLAKPAIRKRDSLNTSEQVSIQLPTSGTYQVRVTGTSLTNAAVSFHISYKTDTLNTFKFLSPIHASDVNRNENKDLNIRWQTFVSDTNQTGNLFISYNSGTTWQLISSSVKLASQRFVWQIKDTNSVAMLRMEAPFGVFHSPAFLIANPSRPQLDFNCMDSFRLSWNKYVYANTYRIYALIDSPYLKPILTITDTAVVLKKTNYPFTSYAVEPLLNNGLSAARSDILNITLQSVHCFYRTLNYTLLDQQSALLSLELSTTLYPDSIFFEKVTQNGSLISTYPGIKVGNSLLYEQQVDGLTSGVTCFRAKIKLKNGSIVYTDIISVLTSGKRKIWFYPSPVRRNEQLTYIMQQGVPADVRLQLFDINGRLLLNLRSISNTINVSGFSPGIIIYKLIDENNKVIETGKVLVL